MENNQSLSLFYCVESRSKMTLKLAVDGKSAKKSGARVRGRLSARELSPLTRGRDCRHVSSARSRAGKTVGT